MRKVERWLKLLSMVLGTTIFSFLCWLMLIYQNFEKTTAILIGVFMAVGVLFGVYRWGYWFISD